MNDRPTLGRWNFPKKLPARLRSRRTWTWLCAATLACGGGYYFLCEQAPHAAVATTESQLAPTKPDTTGKTNDNTAQPTTRIARAKTMPATRPVTAQLVKPSTGVKKQQPAAGGSTPARTAGSTASPASSATSSKAAPSSSSSATTAAPSPAKPAAPQRASISAEALGPVYTDDTQGFTMRFPRSWSIHRFAGNPWVLDCGDASQGMISIGFSPCPPEVTAEQLLPEAIARRIKRRQGTTLHGQGRASVDGRRALWSKSTGPLPMTNGAPRMTRVQYVVPLQDGRVLELRVAAPPEEFERIAPLMRKALATFKLKPRDEGAVSELASSQ